MAFTYFFRDLQTLETIRDQALPYLRTRRYIDIWDAGCAMGPEPYSLAIILRESMGYMYFRNVRIRATDIDISNLFGKTIAAGIYPREELERIPREYFLKYFSPADRPGFYQISAELRNAVLFQQHDLLTLKPVAEEIGLVLCKNVLLHFNEVERIEVIRMFHDVLMDGGYFVTEQTQKLPPECESLFEPVVPNAQLFRKI